MITNLNNAGSEIGESLAEASQGYDLGGQVLVLDRLGFSSLKLCLRCWAFEPIPDQVQATIVKDCSFTDNYCRPAESRQSMWANERATG